MAEVSNLHRHTVSQPRGIVSNSTVTSSPSLLEDNEQEDEDFHRHPTPLSSDLDSLSPFNDSPGNSFLDDYTDSLTFGFNLTAEIENVCSEYEDEEPDCFDDEDIEQMNFVTDLFESSGTLDADNPIWEIDYERAESSGPDFVLGSDPGSSIGLRVVGMDSESDSETCENHEAEDPIWRIDYENTYSGHGFGFGSDLGSNAGLRVVGLDSESDFDESEVNSGFTIGGEDQIGCFSVNTNVYQVENGRDEFEWEEVNERINFDERENLDSVIDRIEDIFVSAETYSAEDETQRFSDDGEEEEGTIEWEVLLAMNNLERNSEAGDAETYVINGEIEASRGNLPQDYILTMEYDTLLGMLAESENALKGRPPAAKSVVENLPTVVLTKQELEEHDSSVTCAVCKDDADVGEKMTKMPCSHLYHGECILPWLQIRNTCPVCRYELPTDDKEYENRRCNRGGGEISPLMIYEF